MLIKLNHFYTEDIVKKNIDKIVLVDFHHKDPGHQEVIDELWSLLGSDKNIKDKIILVDADVDTKYQFYNVLYNLSLYEKPEVMYPYFLVTKNGNGHIVRGERSAQMIHDNIQRMVNIST